MGIIADRIKLIKERENSFYVAELKTGYVVIGDYQNFRGYTLLLCKEPAVELHFLDNSLRRDYLEEMSFVAEAVDVAFEPKKLNLMLLGNADPHLHWHIFPRYDDDPLNAKGSPMGLHAKGIDQVPPTATELEALKASVLKELVALIPERIIHHYNA